MTWYVRFRFDGSGHIDRYPSREAATEAACRLIRSKVDVYGLGTGPLANSLDRDQIAHIYALWADAQPPPGKGETLR